MANKKPPTERRIAASTRVKSDVIAVPKDAKAARRRKWEKLDVSVDSLTSHTWLNLDSFAATEAKPPRIGIGPKPGTHTVCYFNEDSGQYDDCHVVPD